MYKGKKIGVVVPAYNEERFIARVLETMPEYVDRVYVVDDASIDKTSDITRAIASQNGKVKLLNHQQNGGVGKAITTGYHQALAEGIDITAVMAGDNQMAPVHLPMLLDPLVEGVADYAKGDRLSQPGYKKGMTRWRRLGNFLLTWLTRIAAGNYRLSDPQNGYTAINRQALDLLQKETFYSWYGYCNDMLVKLNAYKMRVLDVPIPARYGNERSKIKYRTYIPKVSWLLLRLWVWRLKMQISGCKN